MEYINDVRMERPIHFVDITRCAGKNLPLRSVVEKCGSAYIKHVEARHVFKSSAFKTQVQTTATGE